MPEVTRLTLLGRTDLRHPDGREVRSVLSQPKRVALLAFLSLEGRAGAVARDRIIGIFWPDVTEDRARSSLRTALYQLRQSLGTQVVQSRRSDVRLDRSALGCDAALLLDASAASDHSRVLALNGGELLEGFHLADAAEFDRWLEGRRAEIHRAVVKAAVAAAAVDPTDADVMRVLAELVERRPGEEEAVLCHLEAVHRSRGAGAARAVHAAWIERYREHFEMEPSAAALELLDRLDQNVSRRTSPVAEPSEEGRAPAASPTSGRASPSLPSRDGRRIRTGAMVGLVAAAVVVVMAGVAMLTKAPAPTSSDETADIAVLSFRVQGPERQAHLGRLVGFLLGRELDGPGPPLVWPAEVGSDPEGCTPSSREFETRISGEVRAEGQEVRVRACLLRGDRSERSWEARGSITGIQEAVATLAREIRVDLRLPLSEGVAPPLTVAPGAYPAFVEGERHRVAGRFPEAMAAYDRALALDSTFAWAHYRRSTSAEWLGQATNAKTSADHALAHSTRLTARERMLLDAWRSYLWGDVEQARTAYVSLVHDRPTDPDVWGRLAELRFHWGARLGIPTDSAEAAFQRVLELTPDHGPALLHRIRYAGREADLAELEALASRLSALDAPESERLEAETIVALRSGDETFLRERAVPWLLATDSVRESARLGGLLAASAAPASLERLVEMLPVAEDETRRVLRRILLVYTAAMQGRPGLARARIAELGRSHPDRATELTALMAMLPTAPSDRAEVERALAGVRGVAPPPVAIGGRVKYAAFQGVFPPRHIFLEAALSARLPAQPDSARYRAELEASNDLFKADYRRLVEGFHWSWRGEPERTLNAIREGWLPTDRVLSDILDYPTAMERWLRVQGLLELSREDDALRWLRTFPDAAGYDAAWLPAAWVVEAELLERRGLTGEAAHRFRQALGLWRNAEPELDPWVARAQHGLERSSSSSSG